MFRTVQVTRYVVPLREGGSLPAVVEADDDGLYVLKFRGAGQGARALVAEWVSGEIARALGLPVPEIVFARLDAELARTEADPEIQDLIRASDGLNLAMDYLPGALAFDPAAEAPDAALASRIVWFDCFVRNVDRTARNTNLMIWHRKLWLIDHGASLYFHHGWDGQAERAGDPFPMVREHVLLPWASRLEQADAECSTQLSPEIIAGIVAAVPDLWLEGPDAFAGPSRQREAYVGYLCRRLQDHAAFTREAIDARR
ncbi:MAG: HipA family kinase [Lautropia sp.]